MIPLPPLHSLSYSLLLEEQSLVGMVAADGLPSIHRPFISFHSQSSAVSHHKHFMCSPLFNTPLNSCSLCLVFFLLFLQHIFVTMQQNVAATAAVKTTEPPQHICNKSIPKGARGSKTVPLMFDWQFEFSFIAKIGSSLLLYDVYVMMIH